MGRVTQADVLGDAVHVAGRIVDQRSALRLFHQAIEIARLVERVVGGVIRGVPSVHRAEEVQRRLGRVGLLLPLPVAVRLVADGVAEVAVRAHHAVAMELGVRAPRLVDRDVVVVHAQAITLRVAVCEQAALQQLVGRQADARHEVRRRERGLLDLGEVVLRVAVQLELAHLDERELLVAPRLRDVERVLLVVLRRGLVHHLDGERPLRELAALDGVEQVALMALAVARDDLAGLFVGEVLDALLGLEVELHPHALVIFVDQAERVAAEAVHVTVAGGDAAVGHDDGHLMQRLGQARPEVPVALRRVHVGMRVALHHVVEIDELLGVAQEEHGRVVAHEVPVAIGRVELHGEAADVALGVGRAALACHGGEADEHLGLGTRLEHLRLRVRADVARHFERAVRAGTLRVHASLGDDLAVEVRQLLDHPVILEHHGAALARREGMVVVGNGVACFVGELGGIDVIGHAVSLSLLPPTHPARCGVLFDGNHDTLFRNVMEY